MTRILICILFFLSICQASYGADDWNGPDKKLHFLAGAWFGFVGYAARDIYDQDATEMAKWQTGLLLGTAVGAMKEFSDYSTPGNHFSGKDLAVTAIGAGFGSGLGVTFNYTSHGGNRTTTISKQWRY